MTFTKEFKFVPVNRDVVAKLPKGTQILCITDKGKYFIRRTTFDKRLNKCVIDFYYIKYMCILEDHKVTEK